MNNSTRARTLKVISVVFLSLPLSVGLVSLAPSRSAAAGPTVTSTRIPISGSVYEPQTGSSVNLSGSLHIVTRFVPQSDGSAQVTAYANLPSADVVATANTGISYIALGAANGSVINATPPDPCTILLSSGFMLMIPGNPVIPGNPITPVQFGLKLKLLFDASGNLITNDFCGPESTDCSTAQVNIN